MKRSRISKELPGGPGESKGFTVEEKAAMREYIREKSGKPGASEGDEAVLAKIATMKDGDREMARRVHAIVTKAAPSLVPRLWYGMPAYSRDGKVICHFQDAAKFKMRYSTLGFSDKANLDDGESWPVAFALKKLTPALEAKIAELVKKAVG